MIRKYSKKGLEKRKEERSGYSEFFQKHIQNIKENRLCCAECGERLIGDVSEVAHRLPKQKYKDISCQDDNIVYLCGAWSNNQCHFIYDNSYNNLKEMKNFINFRESILNIIDKYDIKLTMKEYEKWQIE